MYRLIANIYAMCVSIERDYREAHFVTSGAMISLNQYVGIREGREKYWYSYACLEKRGYVSNYAANMSGVN